MSCNKRALSREDKVLDRWITRKVLINKKKEIIKFQIKNGACNIDMNKGKSRIFSRFGKNSFSDEKKDIRKLELFEEKELMIQIMIQELEKSYKTH